MFSMLPSKDGIFVHIIVFMFYFQKQAQIKKLEGENKNLKGVLRDGARELNDKRGVSDNCQACRGMWMLWNVICCSWVYACMCLYQFV